MSQAPVYRTLANLRPTQHELRRWFASAAIVPDDATLVCDRVESPSWTPTRRKFHSPSAEEFRGGRGAGSSVASPNKPICLGRMPREVGRWLEPWPADCRLSRQQLCRRERGRENARHSYLGLPGRGRLGGPTLRCSAVQWRRGSIIVLGTVARIGLAAARGPIGHNIGTPPHSGVPPHLHPDLIVHARRHHSLACGRDARTRRALVVHVRSNRLLPCGMPRGAPRMPLERRPWVAYLQSSSRRAFAL